MIQGYLLDANIIEYRHNSKCPEHPAILSHLNRLPSDAPLRPSLIVLGEVTYGFHVALPQDQAYPKKVLDFIESRFPTPLPIRFSTIQIYGKPRAALFNKYVPKKGRKGLRPEQLTNPITSKSLGIQENDLWITPQALEYNLVLVTNDQMKNLRSVVSDLKVENWALG